MRETRRIHSTEVHRVVGIGTGHDFPPC
jgi:hypothetical protein